MITEKIEEQKAKVLFRNFTFNLGNCEDTLLVLDLLGTSSGLQWFTEIMDETAEADSLRMPDMNTAEVEKKLAELKMSMNAPILFSVPLRRIS